MAHKLANMVKQTGTSAGATALTLTGAPVSPYRAFSAVLSDGDTTEAMVIDRGGGQWQAAIYSYAADVLTFVELIDSPTGAPIDFPAGLKDVFIAPLALAASNDGIGWTEFGIVAAGNSQGTAATLAADKLCHVIDGTTTLGGAVVLPSATGAAGDRPHTIININPTEFDVGVYPSSGESIYPLADNISALINAGG
ncbi:MAG TPA: hypothetical protein VK634_11130, partial [Reyranella sp.]|nr:hypothetical protein [Reyranella sp.]